MDRLIAPNSVALANADTAPVSGTPQFATDGNPAAGIPATQWPAYQYNAIQEELIAILTAAGITPDRTQLGQIAEAIPLLCPGRIVGYATHDVGPGGSAQTFSAPVPAGAKTVRLRAVGGGASGAGSLATGAGVCSTCSGGGAGAWIDGFVMDCSALTAITGTVGSGGVASSGVGNNGGSTTITGGAAWQFVLQGGNGGSVKQDATSASFDVSAQGNGGSTITITGTPLTYGNQSIGAPGLIGLLFNGAVVSGQGASSPFGAGGTNTNGGNGGNAGGNGAGGGGAAAPPGSATVTGGLGSGGYVEMIFFS